MSGPDKFLSFQLKYGAVVLPKTRSQAFIKTGYGSVGNVAVVWLVHETARQLCERELRNIGGHFRLNHPSHLWRSSCLPSGRLQLAHVSYREGQIFFIDGRHRTKTFLEGGGLYIPFDMEIDSFVNLQRDGHRFAAYDTSAGFAEKLAPMLRFSDGMDPFVSAYRQAFPTPLKMDDVIDTSRLFFKLLSLEIVSRTRLQTQIQDTDMKQSNGRNLKAASWQANLLKIMLPALVSMRKQGITTCPENLGFPCRLSQTANSPEMEAEKWAKQLPVQVPLGEPYRNTLKYSPQRGPRA